jgi:hypothetical protein
MMNQLHQIKQTKHLNLNSIKMNKNKKDKLILTYSKQIKSIINKCDSENVKKHKLLIFYLIFYFKNFDIYN